MAPASRGSPPPPPSAPGTPPPPPPPPPPGAIPNGGGSHPAAIVASVAQAPRRRRPVAPFIGENVAQAAPDQRQPPATLEAPPTVPPTIRRSRHGPDLKSYPAMSL